MEKKFQRNEENFVCARCGTRVTGDGYTNHCPACLWGMHVDVNPGDRKAECGGMMRPKDIEQKARGWRILHVCEKCGKEMWVRAKDNDNIEVFAKKLEDVLLIE
jgi:hypothetical protein